MKLSKAIKKDVYGVKLTFTLKGKVIGRAFLYILKNDLHKRPFGLLEDVFVDQNFRSRGLGSQLVTAALAEAKKRKCYKVIATSRKTKSELKSYYARFGLRVWGTEFRIDL
jgi:GNAT superfamily N-acetyltransferase